MKLSLAGSRSALRRIFSDKLAARSFLLAASLPLLLLLLMAAALLFRTLPIFQFVTPWEFLTGDLWRPSQGEFGLSTFISGTLWVTLLALILAVPPCIFASIFLVEYARRGTLRGILPAIDLLAGIPSVVYGVWGLLVVVPVVPRLGQFLRGVFGDLPILTSSNPTGFSILAGGIVLAVMISPIIVSITVEVLRTVPQGVREAALAVGATRWQAIKHAVLPNALPGIIAAAVMGLSRAFGETLAVMMVVGNTPAIPRSVFDPGYPLTALIANNYGEMMSIPRYDAALMGAALLLLVVVIIFNVLSAIVLARLGQEVSS
ncbi:MAG: phosphate ABC transporter permease subunit PstC [Anaerolineales bacterium]|nr:phosphate ABC transporter permease subunit PstC [Anaerolineales bacterium]MCW5855980.1 phosphate ABC transporter permease subunit PstC [Anaerolineales bacterium]